MRVIKGIFIFIFIFLEIISRDEIPDGCVCDGHESGGTPCGDYCFDQFCDVACLQGMAGPECNCADHPIGK